MKNKIIMSFLVTLLIASNLSGCTKDVNFDNKKIIVDQNDEIMKKIYNKISGNKQLYTSKFNLEFLLQYLNRFGIYLSNEQVDSLAQSIEKYKDKESISYLSIMDNILSTNKFGSGFYKAFNISYLSEIAITNETIFHKDICNEVKLLETLIGSDDFYSVLFKGNIEEMISLIMKHTYCTDKSKIREFIQALDIYFENFDLLYSERDDSDEWWFSEIYYEETIKSIMSELIQSKYENDEEFRNSLIGNVLSSSEYFSKKDMSLAVYREKDFFEVTFLTNRFGRVTAKIPSYYLDSPVEFKVALDTAANNIIQENYETLNTETNKRKEMELLSYIVGWDKIEMAASSEIPYFKKKEIFANALSKYFSSEEEFNIFLIALSNNSEAAIRKYMTIWLEHMTNGEITLMKLLEFNSFKQTYLSHCYFLDENGIISSEVGSDIERDEKKNYKVNDFYFDFPKYDVLAALEQVENGFHEQGIDYIEVIDGGYDYRNWRLGERGYSAKEISVLSSSLSLKYKEWNGRPVWYYVLPDGYENGEVVSVFTNVLFERKEVPIQGLITEMFNEETEQLEKVIIIAIGTLRSVEDAVYCKEDYDTVHKMKQLKIR
ncbi:MAG: hypothetical protein E7168_00625 [Firmicutes bacterium]|nr:hypothetical protein [Bacillota bacterium]